MLEQIAVKHNSSRLKILLTVLSIGFGLILPICGDAFQGDTISYLDMGDYFFAGDRRALLNGLLEPAVCLRSWPGQMGLQTRDELGTRALPVNEFPHLRIYSSGVPFLLGPNSQPASVPLATRTTTSSYHFP